jgi:uncharacterized protein (DUF302 family)
MSELPYGYETTLTGVSFDDAVERVTAALKEQGFGVLTEINVKDTLKKKLDVDFRPYVILGACNPKLAHEALNAESQIGLLLPCNAVVQQTGDDEVTVSIAAPDAMFELVDNPAVAPVAKDAQTRIENVMRTLGAKL